MKNKKGVTKSVVTITIDAKLIEKIRADKELENFSGLIEKLLRKEYKLEVKKWGANQTIIMRKMSRI